jgi:hypothetical protein
MVTKSQIAVIAVVLEFLSASPTFAQSFDPIDGTGNELPSYYDQYGALHAGNVRQQSRVAVHRGALNAYASVARAGFCVMIRPTRPAAASANHEML